MVIEDLVGGLDLNVIVVPLPKEFRLCVELLPVVIFLDGYEDKIDLQ